MNLETIIQELNLTLITRPKHFASITPSNGYASDLLSCVMAGAGENGIWVTLQAHANIVAVAALIGLSAVIITENAHQTKLPSPRQTKKISPFLPPQNPHTIS